MMFTLGVLARRVHLKPVYIGEYGNIGRRLLSQDDKRRFNKDTYIFPREIIVGPSPVGIQLEW